MEQLNETMMTDAMAQPQGAFAVAFNLLEAGGPVLYIIAGLSVLTLAIILLKCAQFATLGMVFADRTTVALRVLRTGEAEQALRHLGGTRHPVAHTLRYALAGKMQGHLNREDLENYVQREAGRHLSILRHYLRPLELIATLAPLLGLLGTVLGMIDAFQAMEAAGSRINPAILSGGIWVALLTTAAGLVVAIPAAAAHNLFEGVIERTAQKMEAVATEALLSPRLGGSATGPRTMPRYAAE